MANSINAGFMGYIEYGGNIKFTDCNIAPRQEIVTPDVAHGSWDRSTWYYGAISIEGSASGPVDENFKNTIWAAAWNRNDCGQLAVNPATQSMTVNYFCGDGGSLTFQNILINSVTISASAGDIANWSFDVIGAGPTAPSLGAGPQGQIAASKIVTWDGLGVTVTTGSSPVAIDPSLISSIELTVSNNITPAYTLGSGTLWPDQLITGVRTITGSVTVYNIGDASSGPEKYGAYGSTDTGSIDITFLGISVNANFHRVQPSGQVGPITSTYAFTGVGNQG